MTFYDLYDFLLVGH